MLDIKLQLKDVNILYQLSKFSPQIFFERYFSCVRSVVLLMEDGFTNFKSDVTNVVQIIKCTCTVFIDNFRNISTNSSI